MDMALYTIYKGHLGTAAGAPNSHMWQGAKFPHVGQNS